MTAISAAVGDWMQRHGRWIRRVQWVVVLFYGALVIIPALLPLPDETARVFTHLTVFAQFVFWGIWWPFVLISMVLVGRVWCGVLCPEGALSEWVSAKGRHWPIPRWIRWGGWPFVAFVGTTVYGQMVSVYQYPKAVLLVLGGSTLAAMVVGYLYGREKRVWCKYLCPVNGVFGLLSKLSPLHYKVNAEAWRTSYHSPIRIQAINCAPLVAIRKMEGASDCHMCGRCSGHREAITLSARSPNHEVVSLGKELANGWQTVLILFGLFGVAIGAFQWTVNPHFIEVKQFLAEWLIERNIMWPFEENAPWWLLTHYPEQRDVFSWLDGSLLMAYLLGMGLWMGACLTL
ncbi:MAG: 4Fe-4S binding protein, partial [Polaromonas sp.]